MFHYLYFCLNFFLPRYIAVVNKSVRGSVDYSAHQKLGQPDICVNCVINSRALTEKNSFKRNIYVNEGCFA